MSTMQPLKPGGQSSRILTHFLHGYRLTHIDALELFQCSRLAARVKELRKRGWQVRSEPHLTQTGKRIAVYSLP